jgi:hypothetical protein
VPLVLQALRLGLSGFSAGMSIGKSLIEEQASLLNAMLSYTSGFLGSPYAEMIWCQAVGALFVGMLSELVYTSILGLLGGLVYGEHRFRVADVAGLMRGCGKLRVLERGGCCTAPALAPALYTAGLWACCRSWYTRRFWGCWVALLRV